jgi:toxin secretion/phage lysis holin
MFAYILTGITGIIIEWLTLVPVVVWALIALMGFDITSGLIAAVIQRNVNAEASFHGALRKTLTLILVAACSILAHVVHLPQFHGYPEIPLGSFVAGVFCLHEFISICENTVRAGLRMPQPIRELLSKLKVSTEIVDQRKTF